MSRLERYIQVALFILQEKLISEFIRACLTFDSPFSYGRDPVSRRRGRGKSSALWHAWSGIRHPRAEDVSSMVLTGGEGLFLGSADFLFFSQLKRLDALLKKPRARLRAIRHHSVFFS